MSGADNIKDLVLVASGKGGVGKSTVATHLALALAKLGRAVGLLDADIYGPSIPTLLGAADRPQVGDDKMLQPVRKFGIPVMSMGYLVDPEQAMIWRGPMLAGAVTQLLTDVAWGDLDVLVLDLPPGTGDIQLTLAQKFKVAGAILVTTPQAVALADVRRAKAMFDKVRVEVLGLVENMSYFVCSGCDQRHAIFSAGGGSKVAAELAVQFLGGVPLEPAVREAGDGGEPVFLRSPSAPSAAAFAAIAAGLDQALAERQTAAKQARAKRSSLPIIRS